MSQSFPKIGVVIIGINAARYIADCVKSVLSADYPEDQLEIVYVDGGSRDNSPQIAMSFDKVKVLELNDKHPTPGRGRNAGWEYLKHPLIQFLDADTKLDPLWFRNAIPGLTGNTVAVCAQRREIFPEKNLFHVLINMEWQYEIGLCRYFGGDVLIKREALEKTRGFDKDLVAGEDPELSYRIRQEGWQILRLDVPMTKHDINMITLRQYLRRAYRSGYAYAEIGLRFIKNREKLWFRELLRILTRVLLPISLILAGFMTGKVWLGILLGFIILFRPLISLGSLKRTFYQSWRYTFLYAIHTVVVVYPQFCGVIRYFWGKVVGNPLKNKGIIKEGC